MPGRGILESMKLQRGKQRSAPLYKQISQHIKKCVDEELVKPGEALPTINEMMTHWEVGYLTVKAALDGLQKDGVVEYQPGRGKGPIVMGYKGGQKGLTLLFVRWDNEPIFLSLSEGIRQYANENELDYMMIDASDDESSYINAIREPLKDVNGLLLFPYETDRCRRAINSALRAGEHIVFLDRKMPGINVSSVGPDHFQAGYIGTRHLIEEHRMPVRYYGYVELSEATRQLLDGWARAMDEYGYDKHGDYIWDTHTGEECVERGILMENSISENYARQQLEKLDGKVCIFCVNDYFARYIYNVCKQVGRTIGQDVYIVGSGDCPFCKHLDVPLTSVAQPDVKVGYEAARLLHDEISYNNRRQPVHRVLGVELVVRQSSIAQK